MPTISGIIVPTGLESGGRRTLREIVDERGRPYDSADSTFRALAGDAFRAAVRTMNVKGLWPWEILEEDITITSGTDKYTLSGAVKKPLALHHLSGSAGVRDQKFVYIPYDQFMETYDQNTEGEPNIYTIPNLFETGQIQVWPIPNANDYARITYYRVTPIPKNDDEVVEVPEFALETYIAYAWFELSKRLPAAQTRYPSQVALSDARRSFRELAAHINMPGDRSRSPMWVW